MLIGFGGISDQNWPPRDDVVGPLCFHSSVALLFCGRTWTCGGGWFAGRALMGIGVGLAARPVDRRDSGVHEPGAREERRLAHGWGAQAIGFVAALLLGGALTGIRAMADAPFASGYLPFFLIVLLIGTWFLPRHTPGDAGGDRRSWMPFVPKHLRRAFRDVIDRHGRGLYIRRFWSSRSAAKFEHDLIGSPNGLSQQRRSFIVSPS